MEQITRGVWVENDVGVEQLALQTQQSKCWSSVLVERSGRLAVF